MRGTERRVCWGHMSTLAAQSRCGAALPTAQGPASYLLSCPGPRALPTHIVAVLRTLALRLNTDLRLSQPVGPRGITGLAASPVQNTKSHPAHFWFFRKKNGMPSLISQLTVRYLSASYHLLSSITDTKCSTGLCKKHPECVHHCTPARGTCEYFINKSHRILAFRDLPLH